MPRATLQWRKGRDGPATLTCTRPDGSRTWAQLHPFHPVHDLLHYAVESTLGFRSAFLGLLASGWTVADFARPGAASRLPAEARWAEHLVGLLDQERAGNVHWTPAELNEALAAGLRAGGIAAWREVTATELDAIRTRFAELASRWHALSPSEVLELPFEC